MSASSTFLLTLLAFGCSASSIMAAPPPWWATGGVTNAQPANDYAAVNQGQLKQLAKAAMVELDANLPGGAGGEVHAMVDAWTLPLAQTNDFAAVNLGQAKNVAKPFYNRLIAIGYVANYPWIGFGQPANDFAAANIGQAKNLFNFNVGRGVAGGIPGSWFAQYPSMAGLDINSEASGSGLTIWQKYLLGLDPTKPSTMDDDFTDGWKVRHGLNPLHKLVGDTAGTLLALRVYTPLR